MRLEDVIRRGNRASQPAATAVPTGTLYYVTDENVTERSSGSAWQDVSDTAIANDAVTYAKIQNISATSRILGRKTASAGDTEECTLSEVLDFIGSAAWGDVLYRGENSWARLGAGTSGHFLKTNGAGANPEWAAGGGGSDWDTTITAESDESVTNSSTLQDDDELTTTLDANGVYLVEFQIIYSGDSAAPDLKWQWSGPSVATTQAWLGFYTHGGSSGSAATNTATHSSGLWPATAVATFTVASNGLMALHGRFTIVVDGVGGTLKLTWAQNAATVGEATTRKAGSRMQIKKLN